MSCIHRVDTTERSLEIINNVTPNLGVVPDGAVILSVFKAIVPLFLQVKTERLCSNFVTSLFAQNRNLLKSFPRHPPTSVLRFLLCKRFHLPTNVRCQGSVLTAEAKLRSLERSETEAFATGEQGGKGCEVDLIGLIWFLSGNNSQRQSFS